MIQHFKIKILTVNWDGWIVGMRVCRPDEFRSNAKWVVHELSGLRNAPEFKSSIFTNNKKKLKNFRARHEMRKEQLRLRGMRVVWDWSWASWFWNWFCCGLMITCLGFCTLVFDLANSSRSVWGRSGSKRTLLNFFCAPKSLHLFEIRWK